METAIDNLPLVQIEETFKKQQKKSLLLRVEAISERKARLSAIRKWVLANRTQIQKAVYDDFSKPAGEVDGTEIFHVLAEIKLATDNLDQWAVSKKVNAPITFIGTRSYLKAEPRGVCLIISPWNYPFSLAIGPLISALAAGNTAILKPSEFTPHTAALISRMISELFDESVVSVFEGDYRVSSQLLALPFNHIFFTGSPQVGKVVMKAAAENLSSITLELGGKSPTIVTATAKVKEAAERIVISKFINCGQTCVAPDYILADEKIAAALVTEMAKKITKHFTENGEKIQDSTHYTRIVSTKHWIRLNELLQDALNKGATLECGGEVNESTRFFSPTILTSIDATSRIMEEEIFGPILPVITYSSLSQAISLVNNKPKPLALYIYSQSKKEQEQIEQSTSAGAVCINDSAIHFLNNHLPFGGVNNSGIGSSHGYYGFLAFSHLKPVMKQRNGFTSVRTLYPPYTRSVKKIMDWIFKLF